MNVAGDDLRSTATVLTARELLLEVRSDVRDMKTSVDVLRSQNLHERVVALERAQWKIALIAGILGAIAGVLGYRLPVLP